MNSFYKAILFRFLRGFIAGAAASMAALAPFAGNSLGELKTWLFSLALAGASGGITGIILAADKAFRYKK